MPTYEYHCASCGETFSRREHIEEHAGGGQHPVCPKCGSDRVEQHYSSVFVKPRERVDARHNGPSASDRRPGPNISLTLPMRPRH